MTHADEIAIIKQNHREDLQDIYGELRSINKSVTKIETELPHLAKCEAVPGMVEDETKKQIALYMAGNKNTRGSRKDDNKNDWFKVARNTAYLAAATGGVVGAVLAWL